MTIEEAKQKVISLAQNEIGYHESGNNITKYAEETWDSKLYGFDMQGQPWCDFFVDYLFVKNFGYDTGIAMTYQYTGCCGAACEPSASYYRQNGAFFQTPEVGDQIFFYASDGNIGHTGIVETVNGNTITTIEGNYSDSVCRNTFAIGDSRIAGYGRPKWSLAESIDGTESVSESESDSLSTVYIIPNPDIPDETQIVAETVAETVANTTVITEPISVTQYVNHGVHVCRPSEYSYWVYAMQYLLKKCGYMVQCDGYYAMDTARVLFQFQEDHGLEVDGLCGKLTWQELFKGITLRIGCKGYDVRALQYLLKAQDYFIYTDEIYGTQCYKQVVRFQTDRLLPPTGIVSEPTWNELIIQ